MRRPRRDSGANFGRGSHWIRDEKRLAIYERDGWTCWLCGCRVATYPMLRDSQAFSVELATLDHVLCRNEHGRHNESNNLATACKPCNDSRADTPAVEYVFERFGAEAAPGIIARLLARVCAPLPKASSRRDCSDLPTVSAEAAE